MTIIYLEIQKKKNQQADYYCYQVKRLYLLLTTKEKAMDVPSNLEARRRISFFATSLFMDMPFAPRVRNMLSFRY